MYNTSNFTPGVSMSVPKEVPQHVAKHVPACVAQEMYQEAILDNTATGTLSRFLKCFPTLAEYTKFLEE